MEEIELLQALVDARGPCGQEDEVRALCQKELKPLVDEMSVDSAGNVVGKIKGLDSAAPVIRLYVHMDELSLIVKRINEDGSLRVNPLGGIYPFSFGQGPLDIMGDKETFCGILSFGPMHITKETIITHKMLPEESRGLGKTPLWEDTYVVTRKNEDALKKAGVHPGTRVVVSKTRRKLHLFQDCIGSYFLDNRAAIAIGLMTLKSMQQKKQRPRGDVYFVASASEEIGGVGAGFASRVLPGDINVAIDVGPVAKEYQTHLNSEPIVVYQDAYSLYDKRICDHLVRLGDEIGQKTQRALFGGYGSDASISQSRGQAARAVLLAFPTENTHGYEIIHKEAMANCARLLAAYLVKPE